MLKSFTGLVALVAVHYAIPAAALPDGVTPIESPKPQEVSGVAAVKEGYLVVGEGGDEPNKDKYKVYVWPEGSHYAADPPLIEPEAVEVVVLPNDNELWLVLDEAVHTLYAFDKPLGRSGTLKPNGSPFEFSDEFREVCTRGLEGLAARRTNDGVEIAALWEGGYPDPGGMPETTCKKEKGKPRAPQILLLSWEPGVGFTSTGTPIELKVPQPSGDERFRAPDLVWWDDGFLVLLSSQNEDDKGYSHKWLVGFDHRGEQTDVCLKLEDSKVWGEDYTRRNWEALDRSLDGESLVFGYDKEAPSEIWIYRISTSGLKGDCGS